MSVLEVLRKAKRKCEPCEISTGTVNVRSMSSPGLAAYMEYVAKSGGKSPPMHEIAALGLINDDGSPCYDISTEDGRAALAKDAADLDGAEWQKIAIKVLELSGLTKDAQDEAEKKS